MTEQELIDKVRALLGPAADLLTDQDVLALLPGGVIPDSDGRLPSDPAWVSTWDPHWVAADAAETLAVRGMGQRSLQRVTSEGASFEWLPADFRSMARAIRSRSPIRTGSALGVIDVPTAGHQWDPTSRGWPWH